MFASKTLQRPEKANGKNKSNPQQSTTSNETNKKLNHNQGINSLLQMQSLYGNKAVCQMLKNASSSYGDTAQRASKDVSMPGLNKDEDDDKKPKKEAEKEEWYINSDGSYYSDDNGMVTLSSKVYDKLYNLVSRYDVILDTDIKKRQVKVSEDKDDPSTKIAIGLANIVDFATSNRNLRNALNHVNNKEGFSFMQVLAECGRGDECHNALADKLMACLNTLNFVPA